MDKIVRVWDREYITDEQLKELKEKFSENSQLIVYVNKILGLREKNAVTLIQVRSRPTWEDVERWSNWEITTQQDLYDTLRFGLTHSNGWTYQFSFFVSA